METPKELSIRIHYDWFNKCRTCKHWLGDRAEIKNGICESKKSDFSKLETNTDCYCSQWDSYDIETALEVLDGDWDYIHNPNNMAQ